MTFNIVGAAEPARKSDERFDILSGTGIVPFSRQRSKPATDPVVALEARWKAACDAWLDIGTNGADDHETDALCSEAHSVVAAIEEKIIATPATTIEGALFKMRVIEMNFRIAHTTIDGEFRIEDADFEDRLVFSTTSDVLRLANEGRIG